MDACVVFQTLGCRLNKIESESAAEAFSRSGFAVSGGPVSAAAPANAAVPLCVDNTCAVTQKAEQKTRRTIRLLLEKYPAATVVVTGCSAELSAAALGAIDRRIAVLPGQRKSRLETVPRVVKKLIDRKHFDPVACASMLMETVCRAPLLRAGVAENAFLLSTGTFRLQSRAAIKIQDGCNGACTYCAIRTARGQAVSLAADEVVRRVRALERAGQTEVTLTGVNIAQYRGACGETYCGFTELLRMLLDQTERIVFRISSISPRLIDDNFCATVSHERICPHFHLSVQSGSDAVLMAMGRSYTAQDVVRAVRALRTAKDNPYIACDIIAGFPGETERHFSETAALADACGFTWIHAFPFSPRPGTPAAAFHDVVPAAIAKERVRQLLSRAVRNKTAYISSYEGTVCPAVAEAVRRPSILTTDSDSILFHAVTDNFIHCEIRCAGMEPPRPGERIAVQVEKPFIDRIARGDEWEAAGVLVGSAAATA